MGIAATRHLHRDGILPRWSIGTSGASHKLETVRRGYTLAYSGELRQFTDPISGPTASRFRPTTLTSARITATARGIERRPLSCSEQKKDEKRCQRGSLEGCAKGEAT